MRVGSRTNVITNSSSECFLIRTYGMSIEDIIRRLCNVKDNRSSGVGGDIDVYDNKSCTNNWGITNTTPECSWLLDGYALIDCDWSKKRVIKYIMDNFWVLGAENCWSYKRDPDGRLRSLPEDIVKKISKDKLPRPADDFGDPITHMEYDHMYAEEKRFIENPEEWDKCLDKFYDNPEKYPYLMQDFPTKEDYKKYWTEAVKDWYEKHPIPAKDLYKYDQSKEQE